MSALALRPGARRRPQHAACSATRPALQLRRQAAARARHGAAGAAGGALLRVGARRSAARPAARRLRYDRRSSSPTSGRSPASRPRCSATPASAWLVLACDLPFLDRATLQHLIAHRDAHARWPPPIAAAPTACPSRCARSTSRAAAQLSTHGIAQGQHCPRKLLSRADVELLDQPNPRALDNVNTARGICRSDGGARARQRTPH